MPVPSSLHPVSALAGGDWGFRGEGGGGWDRRVLEGTGERGEAGDLPSRSRRWLALCGEERDPVIPHPYRTLLGLRRSFCSARETPGSRECLTPPRRRVALSLQTASLSPAPTSPSATRRVAAAPAGPPCDAASATTAMGRLGAPGTARGSPHRPRPACWPPRWPGRCCSAASLLQPRDAGGGCSLGEASQRR